MPYLTLGEAANLCGKSKPTLSKAVKSGKMSCVGKNEDGSFQLDPVEVLRVFPIETATSSILQPETPNITGVNGSETGVNSREFEVLNSTIDDLRRRLDDTEKRANTAENRLQESHKESREERERLMLMLQHLPGPSSSTPIEIEPEQKQAPRHRWWQRKEKA